MNKTDIILAGVGGQGILSIAAAIGYAALNQDLHIKQAEVHGMSQRGGAVQSHLRIADVPIYSDLIPKGTAEIILSVEPLESLRYIEWLREDGWLITSDHPFKNIPVYPDLDSIYHEIARFNNHKLISAEQIASDLHAPKSSNMVMLGAASHFLPLEEQHLLDAISWLFKSKGDAIIEQNHKAFTTGRDAAK